jgi:hypothetical protein
MSLDKELRVKIKIDSETAKLDTLNSKINTTEKGFNKADSMASTFISRLGLIGGAVGGLYLINETIGNIGRTGFETNITIQKLTNSLAASISITSTNIDSLGKQITLSEKYAMATDEARLSLEQLNRINLDTPHTLDQTVKIYDAMYIGMKKVGAQSEDIVDITKKLSIAVGDKVGFDAMLSAMDGLSTGTVEVASEMGRFLSAIGLSNEAIKNSTDIVQLFKDKLSEVKAIESFDTKLSNLTNSYNMLTKAIAEPAFNTIENNLKPAAEILDSIKDNLPAITNAAGEIVKVGTSLAVTTLAIKGYTTAAKFAAATNILLGGSYGAVNRSILLATASTRIFSTVLKATPFGLAATAVYFLSDAFMDNAEKSKILEDSLSSTSEQLSKLTKNQLEYNKSVIQQELVQASLDRSNAVAKAVNGSLEDKANADAMRKKFEDLTKASRNVKQALEDINNPKAKLVDVFDSSEIDKLVDDTLNPYGAKIDEINKKWVSNFNLLVKNGKDTTKYVKAWTKEIADLDKEESDKKDKSLKANEKAFKEQEKQVDETSKAYTDIAQIGMSEYEKGLISISEKTQSWVKDGVSLNDALMAQSLLLDELNSKTQNEALKEDLSYYERKVQLMDDSISKELELQGISYTNRILEIEQTTKSIAQKNELIAKETELFNLTVQSMNLKYDTEFKDTMSGFYDDMLDSQIALNNAVYDFGSGFDGVSSKISAVSKSLAAMSTLELTNKKEASKLDKKYIDQFNKYAGDVEKTAELEQQYTKDTAILNEQNIQAQLNGYANIAGSMSSMFEEGTKEAAAFQLVESGLALATGMRAILTQGSGDPYTAFARMASMAAIVSSMLGNIGVAFGMNTTSTYSDAFSSMEANTGTGSVLGDYNAQSKSISNSLTVLEDFAQPQFKTLLEMSSSLKSIEAKIGGMTSLLIQTGGFAFGDGYTGFDTGYKNNVSSGLQSGLGLVGGVASDLLIGGSSSMGVAASLAITGASTLTSALLASTGIGIVTALLDKFVLGGAISGLVGSVIGGIFGKTSVSQSLTDSGLYFADTLLTTATESMLGEAYQTITTTTKKKSWFSSSSSSRTNTYFDALDNETNRQFSLVLGNLYDTVLLAGTALDSSAENTAKSLENFVVSIGKVSLKDKTGDEIQETLTAIFGRIGDDIAKTSFPLLVAFQGVGEGMFETLTRVATGMEESKYYVGRLGVAFDNISYSQIINKQGDVGFEALLQSIANFDEATYGANNNLVQIIGSLEASAEELYTIYITLDELRDKLIFLGQSSTGISSSMIYGAGGVDTLSTGFTAYFENFLTESEQLDYKTQQLTQSFMSLGLSMPSTNVAFKDLLSGLDLTSSAGQELYGRLIILSDSFSEISNLKVSVLTDELDATNTTISSIESITSSLDSVVSNLRSSIDTSSSTSLDAFARSMTTSLLLAQSGDYTALSSSVADTISYSSALNNSDYFSSTRDMQYAQAVAANQFESMNVNLDTELSVLQEIADNTNNMISALSSLTTAVASLQSSSEATAINTAESRYVS